MELRKLQLLQGKQSRAARVVHYKMEATLNPYP